jgi:hypothetical protein
MRLIGRHLAPAEVHKYLEDLGTPIGDPDTAGEINIVPQCNA